MKEENEFFKMVDACDDVETLRNIISIFFDELKISAKGGDLFHTLKSAYSELADQHYNIELAHLYFCAAGSNSNVEDEASSTYLSCAIGDKFPDITSSDWLVLYGRMSLNNTSKESILNACKMFLDNKFDVWTDINI